MTSWYPTAACTYGGVFVREHAKAVRGAGHKVAVLHLAGPDPEPEDGLWMMEEEKDSSLSEGIEAHHVFNRQVPVRGASYALYLWSAIGAYRRLRENGFEPHLIHAHVYGAGVPAAILASRNGIPFILSEHFSGVAQRSLGRLDVRKAHYAYTHAARVLPVSHFLEDSIRNYGIEARFEVVPNVVDTSLFFPGAAPRHERGARRLIFVGNPSDEKGFPTLLHALARFSVRKRDWRLDVIGDGPDRAERGRSAAALGLGEQVTFHRTQPKPVIAQLMRSADLFVLPSRLETFGAAIAEALASGLPVVSTTVGGIPELVDERSGRLVAPDDPVALAEALDDAIENIGTFDRRAIAAAAANRFSLEVVGERLAQIYESVVAESRRGSAR